eukprot:16596-Heterococcus_DN1.PRE.1
MQRQSSSSGMSQWSCIAVVSINTSSVLASVMIAHNFAYAVRCEHVFTAHSAMLLQVPQRNVLHDRYSNDCNGTSPLPPAVCSVHLAIRVRATDGCERTQATTHKQHSVQVVSTARLKHALQHAQPAHWFQALQASAHKQALAARSLVCDQQEQRCYCEQGCCAATAAHLKALEVSLLCRFHCSPFSVKTPLKPLLFTGSHTLSARLNEPGLMSSTACSGGSTSRSAVVQHAAAV